MTIDHSVDSYREYLAKQTVAELAQRASDAERRGRRYVAAFIREVMKAKGPELPATAEARQ